MRRVILWGGGVVLALVLLYLAGAGWFLSRAMGNVLTVGTLDFSAMDAPTDPFALGFRGDPRAGLGLEFADVDVPTPLGDAPAWLVPADAGAAPLWAIYVHGIAGRRENGYRHLSVLAEAGIPTLMITYRNDEGAPASPDGVYAFGLDEWADLDAAVALALERGAENVVIVAESMGGGIAGQFLMRSQHVDRVAALVLDAPALDFPAVLGALVRRQGYPLAGGIERIALWLFGRREPVDLTQAISVDAVAEFAGPVFVAHGSGDRIVPVSISDGLLGQRYGQTTYLRTHGDHLQSWDENPERYRRALLGFLREPGGG